MKKIVLFAFILITGKICAQSSYMYEVAEDAGYLNDGGFLNIIGLIIMLGIFVLFIPIIIGSKIDDYKFNKSWKRRREILSGEANGILKRDEKYTIYSNKSEWVYWFVEGYIDGVGEWVHYHTQTPQEKVEGNWEKPAERYLSGVRKELLGGDLNISILSYKAGYKEGLVRRKLKGDIKL